MRAGVRLFEAGRPRVFLFCPCLRTEPGTVIPDNPHEAAEGLMSDRPPECRFETFWMSGCFNHVAKLQKIPHSRKSLICRGMGNGIAFGHFLRPIMIFWPLTM